MFSDAIVETVILSIGRSGTRCLSGRKREISRVGRVRETPETYLFKYVEIEYIDLTMIWCQRKSAKHITSIHYPINPPYEMQ